MQILSLLGFFYRSKSEHVKRQIEKIYLRCRVSSLNLFQDPAIVEKSSKKEGYGKQFVYSWKGWTSQHDPFQEMFQLSNKEDGGISCNYFTKREDIGFEII